MTSIPALQQPYVQINGFIVSNNATTPNTKLDVAFGKVRDSQNIADIAIEDASTLDFSVRGAGGLDTGSIGASKWYYIYAIASSENLEQPALMASLSATTPLLPAGYDVFGLIAVWPTDASSHLILGYMAGTGKSRQFFYSDMVKVLNDGTSASLAPIDLSSAVPAIQNTPVWLAIEFTAATANDTISIFPGDSSATVGPKLQTGQLRVLSRLASGVAKIKYINSAASCNADIWVSGFEYFV